MRTESSVGQVSDSIEEIVASIETQVGLVNGPVQTAIKPFSKKSPDDHPPEYRVLYQGMIESLLAIYGKETHGLKGLVTHLRNANEHLTEEGLPTFRDAYQAQRTAVLQHCDEGIEKITELKGTFQAPADHQAAMDQAYTAVEGFYAQVPEYIQRFDPIMETIAGRFGAERTKPPMADADQERGRASDLPPIQRYHSLHWLNPIPYLRQFGEAVWHHPLRTLEIGLGLLAASKAVGALHHKHTAIHTPPVSSPEAHASASSAVPSNARTPLQPAPSIDAAVDQQWSLGKRWFYTHPIVTGLLILGVRGGVHYYDHRVSTQLAQYEQQADRLALETARVRKHL